MMVLVLSCFNFYRYVALVYYYYYQSVYYNDIVLTHLELLKAVDIETLK